MSSKTSVSIEKLPGTKMSLLEQIEEKGCNVYSQCRDGYCGSCITKIECGEVDYFKDVIAIVADGYILPCICRAKTNLVKLSL